MKGETETEIHQAGIEIQDEVIEMIETEIEKRNRRAIGFATLYVSCNLTDILIHIQNSKLIVLNSFTSLHLHLCSAKGKILRVVQSAIGVGPRKKKMLLSWVKTVFSLPQIPSL